ncbi:MAG: DnaJ domain-containing protein [Verrucomicrobia subdivision 3 bacterium]|nr:DnaJ domain-containing protein [Limisphaerales bacterium]
MIDYFALLNEPRRPWLDEEELKSKFFALSSGVHPDRAHTLAETEKRAANERYADLNAAYQCLRDPKQRLRHLLELATGEPPAKVKEVPGEVVDLFFQIGVVCRKADEFLRRKTATTSPVILAGLFEEGQAISEQLINLRGKVLSGQKKHLDELRAMSEDWSQSLAVIEAIYNALGYLTRWSAQLQERIVQLAL